MLIFVLACVITLEVTGSHDLIEFALFLATEH